MSVSCFSVVLQLDAPPKELNIHGYSVFSCDGPYSTDRFWEQGKHLGDWDYLTIGSESATSWGTGLSLTYRYKSNFSWKLFVDYDYSEKKFNMKYDPYHYLKSSLTENAYGIVELLSEESPLMEPVFFKKEKVMNYVTLGLSFSVNF